jgi:hypothetical protein
MLMTVPVSGGTPTIVTSGDGEQWHHDFNYGDLRMLAVWNGYALWTSITGFVASVALADPSNVVTLTTEQNALGPSNPVFSGDLAVFLTADDALEGRGAVYSVVPGVTPTMATPLVEHQQIGHLDGLAADEAYAYFGVTDSIQRVPSTGGDAETIVSPLPNPNPRFLAVDETSVYWVDDTGIWRAPKSAP